MSRKRKPTTASGTEPLFRRGIRVGRTKVRPAFFYAGQTFFAYRKMIILLDGVLRKGYDGARQMNTKRSTSNVQLSRGTGNPPSLKVWRDSPRKLSGLEVTPKPTNYETNPPVKMLWCK